MLMCLYTMDGTKKENTLIFIVVHGKNIKQNRLGWRTHESMITKLRKTKQMKLNHIKT